MRHAELQWRDEIIARRSNPTVSVAIRKGWKPKKVSLVRRLLTMAGLCMARFDKKERVGFLLAILWSVSVVAAFDVAYRYWYG